MGIGPPWVTAGDWLTGTPYPSSTWRTPTGGVFTDYNVNPSGPFKMRGRHPGSRSSPPSEAQLHQLVQDCQVATSIAEEPDLGAIWIVR